MANIKRENWVSNFNLIGVPKISEFTFKIDEKSEKSSWIYNSMNLGIDCGEKYGVIYTEMMGGYGEGQSNVIYAHGVDDNGNDDFSAQVIVDWDDRFDEDVLNSIGELSFITVGLEKTNKGKTFYKKFLSAYDAIPYIKEHLEEGMVVNVRGSLRYSVYQEKVQIRKTINSIVLSKVDDASKYVAKFTQSVLLDKHSASLTNVDKDKGVMYVEARVLDYVKEINGVEIKGQYPFSKQFEFEMDLSNETLCKKIVDKLFKVKKGITQVNFEGELIEGGAVVTVTWDDVPQEIKDLVDIGVYTKEDALARCSTNGNREQRMVLRRPSTRNTESEDGVSTIIQIFPERYTEEDLVFENEVSNPSVEDDSSDDIDGLDWLNKLQ